MHLVKLGGSGTVGFEPGAAEPWAAAFSQWLNWSLVMTVSPILATPSGGTLFPQPAIRAALAAMGSAIRRIRGMRKERGRRRKKWAKRSQARGQRSRS